MRGIESRTPNGSGRGERGDSQRGIEGIESRTSTTGVDSTAYIEDGWKNKPMRTRTIAIALLFFLAAPAFAQSEAPPEAPSIAASELSARRASGAAPVVIDVRTPEEYAAGHIPGALNIPFDQVAQRISGVRRSARCRALLHGRSACAQGRVGPPQRRLHLGTPSGGGLAAWQAAGLPVEREQ